MKKLLASLIIMGCVAFATVQAQSTEKGEMAKRMTDSMTVNLGLTEDQVPKVLAINQEFTSQAASAKSEGGGKISKLKKLKAADERRDKALKEVLTAEQFKDYKAKKKENRAEAKEKFKDLKKG